MMTHVIYLSIIFVLYIAAGDMLVTFSVATYTRQIKLGEKPHRDCGKINLNAMRFGWPIIAAMLLMPEKKKT